MFRRAPINQHLSTPELVASKKALAYYWIVTGLFVFSPENACGILALAPSEPGLVWVGDKSNRGLDAKAVEGSLQKQQRVALPMFL